MPVYYLTVQLNVLAAVTDAVSGTLTLSSCAKQNLDFHEITCRGKKTYI